MSHAPSDIDDVPTEPIEPMGEVMTVPEAAKFFRIGRNALYDAIGRGEIPHRRFGKHIRLYRSALVRWLSAAWSMQVAKEQ